MQSKHGNQSQIMGKLRCFALNLLRNSKDKVHNFQASIEQFNDSPETLIFALKQANFL
ncbi:MAG: hypothetical protein Q9M50_03855 [Methylococcales bacterium]|nr:hypothetical protein [Methylococcales bacterium]